MTLTLDERVFSELTKLDGKLDQLNTVVSKAMERLAAIETWRNGYKDFARVATAELDQRVRVNEAALFKLEGAREVGRWLVPTLATVFGAAAGALARIFWG